MPSRNRVKTYATDQYYHIYTRGVAKLPVFLDEEDYSMFLSFCKRYLSQKPTVSPYRHPYPNFANRIELLAYCLMSNHVHLLVYQHDSAAMVELMRSLMTSYSMYFNRKYKRVGPVFQSRYLASSIDHDNYLQHVSRYIHLNPPKWRNYPYSSIRYYIGSKSAEWLRPERVLELFNSSITEYVQFLNDYEDQKQLLDELKWELAHT